MIRQTLRATLPDLLRRYPLTTGRGRISNSALVRLLDPADDDSITLARLDDGQLLWVASNDFVGRSVYYFGDLDKTISTVLERVLRPGDTFVDIGAQFGLYTIQAAARVGGDGRVHSFEPQQRSADLLASSIGLNGLGNVEVHRFGLGVTESVVPISIPDGNVGGGSLVHQFERFDAEEVLVRNASEALFEAGVGPARLVKIDVEGFESEVILGAIDWIKEVQPDAFVVETAARNPLESYGFFEPLTHAGYSFVQIGRNPIKFSILDVNPAERLTGFDIIAYRGDTDVLTRLGGRS
jgi:FkbM family methyltransferase